MWEHLACEAGHPLNFEGISKERMVAVSIAASQQKAAPVQRMFAELLDPERAHALREATRFLEKNRIQDFEWHDRHVATTAPGYRYRGTFVTGNHAHFMMHDGRRIFIGKKQDLPNAGDKITSGDNLEFTTPPAPLDTDRPAPGLEPRRPARSTGRGNIGEREAHGDQSGASPQDSKKTRVTPRHGKGRGNASSSC